VTNQQIGLEENEVFEVRLSKVRYSSLSVKNKRRSSSSTQESTAHSSKRGINQQKRMKSNIFTVDQLTIIPEEDNQSS